MEKKVLHIEVTEKHIADAKAAIFYKVEENQFCPIALALHEAVFQRKYLIKRRTEFGRHLKYITFTDDYRRKGGASCGFSVANTIRIESSALNKIFGTRHLHPHQDIKLPKPAELFIVAFDKGQEVKPFKFDLEVTL